MTCMVLLILLALWYVIMCMLLLYNLLAIDHISEVHVQLLTMSHVVGGECCSE